MAGKFLLCLVLLCVVADYSQCKRFGGSRSSGSSWGRGWGSSSASKPSSWFSSGSSKPSQSSSSWFNFGSSAPKYPSSSSGLSGFGSSAPKYPSSSSGLSGFGSSAPKYPSSSSGLSGFGSSAPKYPSSSSGLSGFGSSAPKYPSSSSGLSGFGSSAPKYPSSSSGLSGSGSSSGFPWNKPSGSGSSKYPSSTGLSGSGSGSKYPASPGLSGSKIEKHNYPTSSNTHHSSNSFNTNSGYGSGHNNYGHNSYGRGSVSHAPSHGFFSTPTYYTAPQHVYITEYRHSGSRYGDILTGLALYNMGRSHSYHNHHYYDDEYYRRRYNTPGSASYDMPKNKATCSLRITENNKVEILKIPCEIVSTFTEGSKNVTLDKFTQTVCVTNYTVINNTLPSTTTVSPVNIIVPSNASIFKAIVESKSENTSTLSANVTDSKDNMTSTPLNITSLLNATLLPTTERGLLTINSTLWSVNVSTTVPTILESVNSNITTNITSLSEINSTLSSVNVSTTVPTTLRENSNLTTNINSTTVKPINVTNNSTPYTITTSNITVMNTTNCTVTTDPLAVKGPPVSAATMECEVDIVTKDSYILRNKVDCSTLLQYAKMPEPKKESSAILPSRSKLKSWLSKPPWWMSLFIAV